MCIRCAGNSSRRSHQTHQHPTHNYSTVASFLSSFFLFPYFLVSYLGLIHSTVVHYSTFTFSAGRSLSVPCDLKVLHPFSTTSDPPRQSFRTHLQQTPPSLRKYACPQLRSHAFEQDVPGCPRLASPLHDSCHWHYVQLCPNDRHDWC
jgi:hypothetical protein